MAKGEVVVTAQQIKNRKKFEKIVTISLLSIVLVLIIAYFVLNIIYNEGSFTISMDKNTYLKSNLVMYESMNDRSSVRKITASNLEFIDNKFILLCLIIISLLINFIFYGISLETIFESIISVSFVVFINEIYNNFKHIFRL